MSDAQLVKLAKLGVRESTVAQHDRNPAVAERAKRLERGGADLCCAEAISIQRLYSAVIDPPCTPDP
jgi:hypothetical protein